MGRVTLARQCSRHWAATSSKSLNFQNFNACVGGCRLVPAKRGIGMSGSRKTGASFWTLSVALGFCAIALIGCGKKEQASSGQVVARIGDQTVTTQELDNELRLANVPPDKQKDPALIRQVLRDLVLRKYLVEQAINSKLDREPGVLLDVLRSREQVLATASLSRTIAAKPITQADIDKYITDNPSKFANRRIITADQIVFPLGANGQAVVDANKNANSLDEIDQKLTEMAVPHSRLVGSFNSGEMPEDLSKLVQAKQPDSVFFVRSGANGVFFKVRSEEPQPLQGDGAANVARQNIRTDRLKVETGMASMSANLDAKYEGNYAAIMKDNAPSVPAKSD
jgi:EpsD family peptidyl-prolyl cis-trans isomerase